MQFTFTLLAQPISSCYFHSPPLSSLSFSPAGGVARQPGRLHGPVPAGHEPAVQRVQQRWLAGRRHERHLVQLDQQPAERIQQQQLVRNGRARHDGQPGSARAGHVAAFVAQLGPGVPRLSGQLGRVAGGRRRGRVYGRCVAGDGRRRCADGRGRAAGGDDHQDGPAGRRRDGRV